MRRSLVLRLTLAFAAVGVGTAALIAVVVNVAFGARFGSYVSAEQQARRGELVGAIAASYRHEGRFSPSALAALDPLAAMADEEVSVLDTRGRLVWSSGPGASGAMAAMDRAMMGTADLGPAVRLPVMVSDVRAGTALIRLPAAGPPPADQAFRSSIERLLLLTGIGAGLLSVLVGLLLARRVTAPVRALTTAARSLAGGERAARLRAGAPDELGEMAAAFNAMADAVEAEDILRCSFARDVAHELRTPLTVLQSQIEALQDGLASPNPETLASLHEETLRLGRLVADLETLASADGAPFALERQVVVLAPLVEATIADFSGPMRDSGLSVSSNLSKVTVEGDPARLRQVVANLLSNAVKFVPPGGHIRVGLASDGTWASLQVADNGPGIAPEDLPHVFERFFRGRGARAGGSGIGLAVVTGLVKAHGGEVAVASEPGEGAAFTVRLPQTAPGARRIFAGSSLPPRTVRGSPEEGMRPMKLTHTTRWVITGAALGLSAALFAGVAFSPVSGPPARPATSQASLLTAPSGGPAGTGFMGGASMGGASMGGSVGGGSAGMMGGTAMMGGAAGGSSMMGGGDTISAGGLSSLVSRGEQGATVDTAANTVTYAGRSVSLVALASPHGKPNMTWEIDGLVNPTVSVATGARVTVVLVNTDWGYMHGFELTTTQPPYPEMAMAGVADNFFLMPLPPRTEKDTATASYYTRSASFTAAAGTYHYLCPVPGHAAAGMFGTLVVS